MATGDLIDDRVSVDQVTKAVETLHAYESKKQQKREETELLTGKEPNIWLNVAVKQVAPKGKIKPVKIPIVHPLVDPRTTSICLITKDPQREYKDLLESQNIKFISRVVGIAKLKGKYKPFEARRLLLKENGLFLADDRVIPLLPKLLGSKWFEAKKQPIPVSLTKKDLKGELERAISSTYMNQNNGTCTSIKVGNLSQKPSQVLSNIQKAIPAIASHIYGGWDNIQSFFIKTNTSASLPVWSCDLETGKGVGSSELVETPVDEGASSGVERVEEGEPEKKSKKREQNGNTKGKKRAPPEEDEGESDEDTEDTEEQPRKKAKSGKTSNLSTAASRGATKTKTTPSLSSTKLKQSPSTPVMPTDQKPSKKAVLKNKPSAVSAANAPAEVGEGSKPKKSRPSGLAVSEKADQKSGELSKKELKQKRAGASTLERKKDTIVAGKGIKGMKAKLLGKKALQA